MKTINIATALALFSASLSQARMLQNEPEEPIVFPAGQICCRAYPDKQRQGAGQNFCMSTTDPWVVTWDFDDIDMDYIGSYYCMPEAAFSFCQQAAASNSECDYQSNIPSSVPGYSEGMESSNNVKNAESTIVTQVQLRANV